jgi:GT2 family glycosyltransferase
MKNTDKRIAVILLNFNGKNLLERFLPYLMKYTDKKISNLYVIDNASNDDSVSFLKENYSSIKVIINKKNLGYAGGYNEGVKSIKADYYVFINTDVEVTSNWLNPLFNKMESNSNIGACQPKILSEKNKNYFEYAGASGGYIDFLGYPYCRGRIFDTIEKDYGQYNEEKEVFWTSGSCMIIQSSLFHKLNGFDKDFFAHMEEIDLCWRIKRKGFINYCIPKSVIYHIGGETLSYLNPKKTYLNFRNNLIMISKNDRFINLLYKIPSRLILDIFAAIKILINKKSIFHFTSILRAYLSFITFLPIIFFKKRNNKLNYINLKNLIIPFEYFIRGKKRFSDL